jgi:protein-S-isoprenylcysteine O-methyltransferase Ste14
VNLKERMQVLLAKLKFLLGWNRIAISLAGSTFLLIFASPSLLSLTAGTLIVTAGAALRTWSSGYVQKNRELSMDGPYAHVRHPLYVGNFLLGLGFAVMTHRWFLIVAFFVIFYLLYSSVIHEEEKTLQRHFGGAYAEYTKNVPAFIPSFSSQGPRTGHFTWELVRQHREYQAWLGILGGIFLLTVKMIWLDSMWGN